jgi:hypothetical protein
MPDPSNGLSKNFQLNMSVPVSVDFDLDQIVRIHYRTKQIDCVPTRAEYQLRVEYIQRGALLSYSMKPVQPLSDMWNSTSNIAQSEYLRNYSSQRTWEASAPGRYLAINIYYLIDRFTDALRGTVPSCWITTHDVIIPYDPIPVVSPGLPVNITFPDLATTISIPFKPEMINRPNQALDSLDAIHSKLSSKPA